MTIFRKRRTHSWLSPALALLTGLSLCALLLPFVFAYGFIYPQGDDFDSASRAVFLFDFIGGIYEIFREWFTWSGRYTLHFMLVFFGKAAESRFWSGAVCFGVLCSYAFAFWWLISPFVARHFYSRLHAAILSLGALLALYASYGSLPNFYLLTDALSIAHQGATALFFLALVIMLWQKVFTSEESCKREWRRALLTGIFAIGVYEHAALAVICISVTSFALACVFHRFGHHLPLLEKLHFQHPLKGGRWRRRFNHLLGKLNLPAIRPFLTLTLCLLLPLAISFLAPGNFVRQVKRGVDIAIQMDQISQIWPDWKAAMLAFFESPWIPLLLCLLIAIRLFVRSEKKTNSHLPMLAAAASIICFLVFSFSMIFLHALSDAPFHSQPKMASSFGFYAAITFAALLFNALAHISFPDRLPRYARALLAFFSMGVFSCLVFNTHNFQASFINAVNGNLGILAEEMENRDKWLADLRNDNKIEPDPTGLLGEILFPGIRERKVRPDLPQAVVDRIQQPVFPVYSQEALAEKCESWPNLWAAWMYGQGCVRAVKPVDIEAVRKVERGGGQELQLPENLRESGFSRAWLVNAAGGRGPSFALEWLLVEFTDIQPLSFYVLRPNPVMRSRLAPLRLQEKWLDDLLAINSVKLDMPVKLATTVLQVARAPMNSHIKTVSLGQLPLFGPHFPEKVFISLNGTEYYALNLKK